MDVFKIGIAQCPQTGDYATNARTIRRFLEDAARASVQILCFPETQTVGYRVDISTPERPVPVAELEDLHGEVARFCGREGMACVLGTETPLANNPGRKPYNSALVVSPFSFETGIQKIEREPFSENARVLRCLPAAISLRTAARLPSVFEATIAIVAETCMV